MRPHMYQMNPAKKIKDVVPSLKIHSKSSMEIPPMSKGRQNIRNITLLIECDPWMTREKDLWGMMKRIV